MSLFHAARAMCCDTGKSLRKNNWARICTHRVSTHALPEQVLSQAILHCDLVAGLFSSDTSHAAGHQSTHDAHHVLCRASNGYSQVFRVSQRLQQMLYAQQKNSPSTRAQKRGEETFNPQSARATNKEWLVLTFPARRQARAQETSLLADVHADAQPVTLGFVVCQRAFITRKLCVESTRATTRTHAETLK